jgi:hypothetical protein
MWWKGPTFGILPGYDQPGTNFCRDLHSNINAFARLYSTQEQEIILLFFFVFKIF